MVAGALVALVTGLGGSWFWVVFIYPWKEKHK
jgi:hypothetical protein